MPADVRLQLAELVRFEHVGCSYGPAAVIEDVTFTVTEREYVASSAVTWGVKRR